MGWDAREHTAHLEKLIRPGLIGTYRSFEVTEIFGFCSDVAATNIFTLLVAEPSEPATSESKHSPYLNSKPLTLRGCPWRFGVKRYRVALQQVLDAVLQLEEEAGWCLSGDHLRLAELTALPPQFVPADSHMPHPWNSVLKNNFWNGSHICELFDTAKTDVRFLLKEPKLLTQLAALVQAHAPIGLDGLSDRLGNVVIQLPVTIVTAQVGSTDQGDLVLQAAWHPQAESRPLRASYELFEDATLEGYSSKQVGLELAKFPLHLPGGGARYVIWDDANEIIVGASTQTSFITSVAMTSSAGAWTKARNFAVPSDNGVLEKAEIFLRQDLRPRVIGKSHPNPREPWRSRRVFRDSLHKLQERKEFVQYGGPSVWGRSEALKDVRWLLANHGKTGAWLWDPYLDAKDVLTTLFYCPHPGSNLRALTMGIQPRAEKCGCHKDGPRPHAVENSLESPTGVGLNAAASQAGAAPSWKDRQALILNAAKGNCEGLELEFRIRNAGAGWPFHDRFLIFPGEAGGTLAWSLGTSVNSLGRQHHILQKVSDGELISQAFLELWSALHKTRHCVWKTS